MLVESWVGVGVRVGGSLLTGTNSRVFQKEAKSEGHPQNHAGRGTAGRVRSSCVKNMQQGQRTREKTNSFPETQKCFTLAGTCPAGWDMAGGKLVEPRGWGRSEESSSNNLQHPSASTIQEQLLIENLFCEATSSPPFV